MIAPFYGQVLLGGPHRGYKPIDDWNELCNNKGEGLCLVSKDSILWKDRKCIHQGKCVIGKNWLLVVTEVPYHPCFVISSDTFLMNTVIKKIIENIDTFPCI
jgi:hypothetical protein